MPLLAVLYWMAIGWFVRYYKLDKKMAETVHGAVRGLMREQAHISLEVYRGQTAQLFGPGPDAGQLASHYQRVRADDGWLDAGLLSFAFELELPADETPVVVPPNG